MYVASDELITLTSKSREVLGWTGRLNGADVEWPEGFDPSRMDCDDIPDPIAIGGKRVLGVEDDAYVGDELLPRSEDSTATFKPGEAEEAVDWVLNYYRDACATVDEETLSKIRAALRGKDLSKQQEAAEEERIGRKRLLHQYNRTQKAPSDSA